MKHFKSILYFAFLFLFLSLSATAQNAKYSNGVHKGVVKVKFSSELTPELQKMKLDAKSKQLTTGIKNFDAVSQTVEATTMARLFPENPNPTFEAKLRKHGLHLWYIVNIPEDADPIVVAQQFQKLPEVKVAEAEYEKVLPPTKITNLTKKEIKALRKQKSDPTMPFNDFLLHQQWHYNNTDADGYDINLFKAWEMTAGRNDIIVSIHDQGVDMNHEDLKANFWINETELYGQPGVDDDGNGYIDDIYGWNYDKGNGLVEPQNHGTHVAGTVAAVNNNNIGVAGVAGGTGNNDGVKIMPLQILGGVPGAIARSYIYAADMGAVISQNSWGYQVEGSKDDAVHDAIKYFIAEAGSETGSPMKGGIVIFAAGNSDSDGEWYPNRYEEVMSVAALNIHGVKAGYSNYGDWVDISGPGGEAITAQTQNILSTTPYDNYGWLDGTSMACPHVSGIAALIIANSRTQITNDMVWDRLLTGVVDVERKNPNYIGKLGSGAADAYLAIKPNGEIAPDRITDLANNGTGQDFVNLKWTIPADEDDDQPLYIQIYYSTSTITEDNLSSLNPIIIKNNKLAGEEMTYELEGLLSTTKYYIAVRSLDRWANVSTLSNVLEITTNNGPAIAVDPTEQTLALSATDLNSFVDTKTFNLKNNDDGVLRWSYEIRTKGYWESKPSSAPAKALNYPERVVTNAPLQTGVQPSSIPNLIRATEPIAKVADYETKQIIYTGSPTNVIGDSDKRLPNSSATRFIIDDADGFNLTAVEFWTLLLREKGPAIIEIYSGANLEKAELLLAQEYTPPIISDWGETIDFSGQQHYAYLTLNEHLFFPDGSTFWVVVHVPSGNQYPFGIGYELEEIYSSHCFLSHDMGTTWTPLETALADKQFAYDINVYSRYAKIENYLSLNPVNGEVLGNSNADVDAVVDATYLDNGYYEASILLKSNDPNTPVYRLKAEIEVTGQVARLSYPRIVDFGNVFIGQEKTLQILIENVGYGNTTDFGIYFNSSNPDFICNGGGYGFSIASRNSAVINVGFKPSSLSNINSTLTFEVGGKTHSIMLVGAGLATPEITFDPAVQSKTVALGDIDTSYVTVKNTGEYPLSYFIPGFDDQGIGEDWPTSYNAVPYVVTTSWDAIPVLYEYDDIAATGIDITQEMRTIGSYGYYAFDFGFSFPFFTDAMETIYIAQKGFTVFAPDPNLNPNNSPKLEDEWTPAGLISLFGDGLVTDETRVYVERRDDRAIIQYQDLKVGESWAGEVFFGTAQMVLHKNGDIRLYYKHATDTILDYQSSYYILMEDVQKENGFMIYGRDIRTWTDYTPFLLQDSLAIAIDYPGPDIILSMQNASGILAPGDEVEVQAVLTTEGLTAGTFKRTLNFVCNDPQGYGLAQVILNVTGGAPKVSTATTEIDFGTVYLESINDDLIQKLVLRNDSTGIANVDMSFKDATRFSVVGTLPFEIDPGTSKTTTLEVDVTSVGELKDTLIITEAGQTIFRIPVKATVKASPVISITDLALVTKVLDHGDIDNTTDLTIENTGASPLNFTLTGEDWLYVEETSSTPINDYDYTVKKSNDGLAYKWIDLIDPANKLPDWVDLSNPNEFWRAVELAWPITFYGEEYDSIKVGEGGLISIGGNPVIMAVLEDVPTSADGGFIFALWSTAFSTDPYTYPDKAGLYFKAFDDKQVVSYEYMRPATGMGDAVSFQVIFFKNGIIKIQYKINGVSDGASEISVVGIESPDKSKYTLISRSERFSHGSGLFFTLFPKNTYSLDPSETFTGKLVLDAMNIYGGEFASKLTINSNDPINKVAEKEANLTVNGTAVYSAIDTLDFGSIEVGLSSNLTVSIKNAETATGGFTVERFDPSFTTGMMGSSPSTDFIPKLLVPDIMGYKWEAMSALYYEFNMWMWTFVPIDGPKYILRPNDGLDVMVTFTPPASGEYFDSLQVTTTEGVHMMYFRATAFDAPVIHLDQTPIVESFSYFTDTAVHKIAIKNDENSQVDLEYSIAVEYVTEETEEAQNATNVAPYSQTATPLQKTNKLNNVVTRKSNDLDSIYDKVLDYAPTGNTFHSFMGMDNPNFEFTIATRFNSGDESFNLSNIGFYFRKELLNSGVINVEVRAFDNEYIHEGTLLASGIHNFVNTVGNDTIGSWIDVELNKTVSFYPNQNFFVLINFPRECTFPLGFYVYGPTVSTTFLFKDAETIDWYDVQTIAQEGWDQYGWMVYAAQKEAVDLSWIEIMTPATDVLSAGDSAKTEVKIKSNGVRGTQYANIVYTSNATATPTLKVPVSVRLNNGPEFYQYIDIQDEWVLVNQALSYYMREETTTTFDILVKDLEGDTYELENPQADGIISYEHLEGADFDTLRITFTTAFGDQGRHEYVFVAEDERDVATALILILEVAKTNRAPLYTYTDTIIGVVIGTTFAGSVYDFFTDPDGDKLVLSIDFSNHDNAEILLGEENFEIRSKVEGMQMLTMTAVDPLGLRASQKVSLITGTETSNKDIIGESYTVTLTPNPVKDIVKINSNDTWNGNVKIEIVDLLGKVFMTKNYTASNGMALEMNVSELPAGSYVMVITTNSKRETISFIKE